MSKTVYRGFFLFRIVTKRLLFEKQYLLIED